MTTEDLIARFPEINPSNYDHDDAIALNEWGIEAAAALREQAQEIARLNEDLAAAHKWQDESRIYDAWHEAASRCIALETEVARLSETWTDNNRTTWTPPTAWAYAQVCVAHESLRTQVFSLRAKIETAEAERDAALGAVRQQADALHELAKERDEQRKAADMIAEERDTYAITCDALRANQRAVEAEREAAHRCIKALDETVANLGGERDDLRDDIEKYIERDTERVEERDALRADAERWKMAESMFKDMGWKGDIIVCTRCEDDRCQEWHRVPTITKRIDAAIDAARAREQT